MKFYACSAGEPGKNYDQDNYDRIIKENAFIMDSGVTQRGYYDQVERGDILIIKYQSQFNAYGIVTNKLKKTELSD